MSSVVFTNATRTTRFSKPADTNFATPYTVTTIPRAGLDGLNIASGAAAAYTVAINDGTTDYLLADAVALGANSRIDMDFGQPVLLDGWAIKVKSSVPNALTFTLTISEHYRMTSGVRA